MLKQRELHWGKLDVGTTTLDGSVHGGTTITRWVAFAHGEACTRIQLHLQHFQCKWRNWGCWKPKEITLLVL